LPLRPRLHPPLLLLVAKSSIRLLHRPHPLRLHRPRLLRLATMISIRLLLRHLPHRPNPLRLHPLVATSSIRSVNRSIAS